MFIVPAIGWGGVTTVVKDNMTAEQILKVLTSQKFVDWHSNRFDQWIKGGNRLSKTEILLDIRKLFGLGELKIDQLVALAEKLHVSGQEILRAAGEKQITADTAEEAIIILVDQEHDDPEWLEMLILSIHRGKSGF